MGKGLLAIVLVATSGAAFAQMSPVGLWRNVDDKTGQAKAEIRVTDRAGQLSGRIEKSLVKDGQLTCTECTDDRKGQPMIGLEIIRGGKQEAGKDVWSGGQILDPESGKDYRASYTPIEGGKKLQVRGYLGPFWRTQTWNRVQ
jgi:uncharacterized protein (DUF2147 family)